jgi:hypothetical protein
MPQKQAKHQFSVGGHEFSLDRNQVRYKLNTIKARDIEEIRKYYVQVDGRMFPIKHALKVVEPKLLRSGFNSSDGLRVFRKLDFEVGEI